jgi:serine protease
MKKRLALGLILTLSLILILVTAVAADTFKQKSLAERIRFDGEIGYVKGEILVKYREGITQQSLAELNTHLGTEVLSVHRTGVRRISVPPDKTAQDLVRTLQRDPRVEYAELNSVCHAHMVPNDPYYPYQWHFPKVNCPQAWDISTGSSVTVGILDSGIAYENYAVPSYELDTVQSGVTQYMQAPDLAGTSFTAGYDFINNDSHANDNFAHGTHVAGTVAQTTNNSYGVAGMAFDCTLMPVKVLDYTGSGTAQSLADGLYWATDHGAQVINMSLGWPAGYNPGATVQNAIQYAYNHGVVLLASSGNSGVSTISYPAAYSEVIAVGATRYDDARPSYSQYGSALEICAPGGDLGVDQNGDGYGDGVLQMTFTGYNPGLPQTLSDPTDFGYWFYDGTSMACPHATALVAMVIANGQTGVENIRTILHETAVDLGSTGWDQYYGYGRIDAYAALTYGGQPPTAQFSGSPTSGCDPLTVDFTDQSTGEITTWDWNFGDGSAHSSAQNPTHQYTNPANYTVSLTVTAPYGSDTETKTDYIRVAGPPAAAFYGTPTSGNAPLTVNFCDGSTGQITSWDWDFGDGSTHSSAQNPAHEYTDVGDYTVTLTVTGPCGSDGEAKTAYIDVTPPDEWTVITYDDFEGGWGSYTDGGGDCYLYTYGTYAHQGSNAADIQDNSGTASSFYHTTGYDVSGYEELEVEFWFYAVSMDNSSEDFRVQYYDGSAWQTVATYARSIDFENNTFYHEIVPISSSQYNYPTSARLRFMCDASGNADDVYIDEIEFRGSGGGPSPPPVADFVGNPTSGPMPLTVNFTDQSTGQIASWDWNFGDGGTSTDQNPSHQYTAEGSYTVTLTVTGPGGSDDKVRTDYITVTPGGWTVITYDDFEGGWGNYTDGGDDCYLYTGSRYAHQASNAANIQDNSGMASSFYHTVGYDVSGYTELEVEFWFYAVSMDNSTEDFRVQYYDGSTWQTVATYARSTDFENNIFYNEVVSISSSQYAFPTNARLRFMCDASGNWDDVYIDEIELRGLGAGGSTHEASIPATPADDTPLVPARFALSHNRPNPFTSVTEFTIALPRACNVKTVVYNMMGQRIKTLVDEDMGAGTHAVTWDGTNDAGQKVASGVYFYQATTEAKVVTKRMVLTR